jgi:hypothetical protein
MNSLRLSRRKTDQLEREKLKAEARAMEEQRVAEATYARRIVALWNARAARARRPSFYPTFGTVMAAGTPLLTFMCPACQQVSEVDLRTFDRHSDASVSSVIPELSCRRCSPNPPFAALMKLQSVSTGLA